MIIAQIEYFFELIKMQQYLFSFDLQSFVKVLLQTTGDAPCGLL